MDLRSTRTDYKTRSASQSNVYNTPQGDERPEGEDSVANKQPEGIIYDTGTLPDSVLQSHIFSFGETVRDVKIRLLQNPTLLPTGLQSNDPLAAVEECHYASLGALGQVHQSLLFNPTFPTICFAHDPLPYYRQLMHKSRLFQAQTPYTLLGYGSSLDKDYQIHVVHTQNIRPRWNIAMLYDLVSRDGLYTNSGGTSHYLDLTTNYYSQDARYQMQAAIVYNRIRHAENGGVTNDTTCWDYSQESGVPVNMYTAQNQWRDIEIRIHQSYNTVRQFERIREYEVAVVDSSSKDTNSSLSRIVDTNVTDTIARTQKKEKTKTIVLYDTIPAPRPSTFNSGVFALDISYSRHRRIFSDNQATSWFYNYGTIDTTFFFDSTAHHQLAAEAYWTNDAHMQHRYSNPVVLTGGLRTQYDEVRFANPDDKTNEINITQFASARLHVGRFLLVGNAEETNGPRRLGDYHIDGTLSLDFRNSNFSVSALSQAQSPDIIFYHNEGVYNWSHSDYNKIKLQRIAAEYSYKKDRHRLDLKAGVSDSAASTSTGKTSAFQISDFRFQVASSILSDNIWFNSEMLPSQGSSTAMLLQADLCTHMHLGWLNLRTHQMLQHSSDNDVIRVPLFASKNSLFADFKLFHGALRTQLGVDLRYHTKFFCDGWNPVLGAFYRQNEVEVGDYFIADLWLTLQVKRATIYVRASHLNAPIEKLAGMQPSYFSIPHYPYENYTIYWGLIWRFFD